MAPSQKFCSRPLTLSSVRERPRRLRSGLYDAAAAKPAMRGVAYMILLETVESRAAVDVSKRVETEVRLNQRFQLPSTPPVPADLTAVLEPNAHVRAGP